MNELPDIEEITIALDVIAGRAPAATPSNRSGSDDEALSRMQVEVDNVLGQDTPPGYASQDDLRILLGRINDTIEARAARRS